MAQQFRLQDHCQILCRRGTLVYRRLRRSCLVWVLLSAPSVPLHSRLQMPAILDFRACRSQAPRRARSGLWLSFEFPGRPPWFTAPRTVSSAHSARPIRWSTSRGVVPRSTRNILVPATVLGAG